MSATTAAELEARVRELEAALEAERAKVRVLEAELTCRAAQKLATPWPRAEESAALARGDTPAAELESKLGLRLSKRALVFTRSPRDPCPVLAPAQDTFVIANTSGHQLQFFVSVPEGAPAFLISAWPGRGLLRAHSEVSITVRVALQYTTRVSGRAVRVSFFPRRGLLHSHGHVDAVGTAHVGIAAEGALSELLDPDEIALGDTPLGNGSSSSVFRGTYRGLPVAVKIPKLQQNFGQVEIGEFRDELDLMRQLHAREIVSFCGASVVPGRLALCFELIERGTLERLIAAQEIPLDLLLRYAYDVATALCYLHSNNVLFRGLEPSNIYVISLNPASALTCKLGGFGNAKNVDKIKEPFDYNPFGGDVHYQAPELLANKPYNHKIDMFAFAVTLWQAQTRILPWSDVPLLEINTRVCEGKRPHMSHDFPKTLKRIITACWEQDPEKRPEFSDVQKMVREAPEYPEQIVAPSPSPIPAIASPRGSPTQKGSSSPQAK